jgi:exosortase
MDDYRYSAVNAAPFLCLFLLYLDRNQIFSKSRFSPGIGLPLFSVAGILAFVLMHRVSRGDEIERLFPVVLAIIVTWLAAFILCYGLSSFKASIYPLCCLLLTVPIPARAIDSFSAALQNGSAVCSYALLQLCGVSVYRQGTMFAIPGLEFNIAPQCSGIRSASAFVIVALLAGRLFLRSSWARILLVASTIPIAIFKNAVRITVTTSLGAFVDRSFIDGPFHHQYGGMIFAPVDALLFIPLLLALQKLDKRARRAPVESPELSTT